MNIFIIEGNIVKPSIEVLLIPEFAALWDRDKSKNKNQALDEFTFIEFMHSPKKSNPFHGYSEEQRPSKIKEMIFKKKRSINTEDKQFKAAEKVYLSMLFDASLSMQYYLSVKKGVHKMIDYYENLDLTERNERGQLVHKITEVSNSISKSHELLQSLDALRVKVEQELYESTRTKSNKEINHFEK